MLAIAGWLMYIFCLDYFPVSCGVIKVSAAKCSKIENGFYWNVLQQMSDQKVALKYFETLPLCHSNALAGKIKVKQKK